MSPPFSLFKSWVFVILAVGSPIGELGRLILGIKVRIPWVGKIGLLVGCDFFICRHGLECLGFETNMLKMENHFQDECSVSEHFSMLVGHGWSFTAG